LADDLLTSSEFRASKIAGHVGLLVFGIVYLFLNFKRQRGRKSHQKERVHEQKE